MKEEDLPEHLKISGAQAETLKVTLMGLIDGTNYVHVFASLSNIIREDMDDYVEGEEGVTDEKHMELMQNAADTLAILAHEFAKDSEVPL